MVAGGNPFDRVVEQIQTRGYHNHRLEDHSDLVSDLVLADLRRTCRALDKDLQGGVVRAWKNVNAPGGRRRLVDLLIARPLDPSSPRSAPNMAEVRLAIENKSVITAHRNRDARFDDLRGMLETVYGEKAEAVIGATVLVGTALRVLNVPDRVKAMTKGRFDAEVLPRLSRGDQRLWTEFSYAVSVNKPNDPAKTKAKFESLPTRLPAHTHVMGFDWILLVPVHVDNVGRPSLDRENKLGIDVDRSYGEFLQALCKAYTVRWHP
ncbi:MAG: hypothetical protein ACT4PT_03650 [Methanobacteriota archaeon]